jgi:hypothetical protein
MNSVYEREGSRAYGGNALDQVVGIGARLY